MDRRDIVDPAGGQWAVEVDLRVARDRSGDPSSETPGSGNDREEDEEDARKRLRAPTTTGCGGTLSTNG